MQNAEMVDAILDGQGDGLAAAYDRYAPALYGYGRSLLGEPAAAGDAVQDTFIVAVGALGGLGEPGRLRPWLYAVARNECHRRLRARALAVPPGTAGGPADDAADLGADAESAELRAIVRAALAGLDPGDREIAELNLRHDLDGQDLADVLGVSANQARALVSRARARFEASLRALLTARTGLESCPRLAAVRPGWDGQLNALLRQRINRHAGHCGNCRERGRYELDPATLLGMLPAAVPPAGLRGQLFDLAGDVSPVPAAYRAGVIRRAGPFRRSGFPISLDPPHAARRPVTWALAAGAGAAALAVIAGGILLASGRLEPSAPHSPARAIAGPAGTPSGPARAGVIPPASSGPTAPVRTRRVTGAAATASAVTIHSAPSAASARSRPPASPSPGPTAGTLAASPTVVTLHLNPAGLAYVGSFTLTAQGGPISSFRIGNPDPLDLAIRPGTGSLAPGQTVTVRLTVLAPLRVFASRLALHPGPQTVIVHYPPAR
jgi:RNA polymerase sigma factor (sigma-70 family)